MAVLFCVAPGPTALAGDPALAVLFVGNSHLLMPGQMKRINARLRSRLTAAMGSTARLKTQTVAKIGWTLTKTRRKAELRAALAKARWDIIVLQESTTAFMTRHGRANFGASVKWFDQNKPPGAKLLLWQAWPQGSTHDLYHRRGPWARWFKNPPSGPRQLFGWISDATEKAAKAHGLYIAPIGGCWMRLPRSRQPYAGDDYHASVRGMGFIADVVSSSIVQLASARGAAGSVGNAGVIGNCP